MNDETSLSNAGHLLKNSNNELNSSSSGSLFKKLLKSSDSSSDNIENNCQQQHQHLINSEHKLLNDLLSKPIANSNNLLNNSAIAMFPSNSKHLSYNNNNEHRKVNK